MEILFPGIGSSTRGLSVNITNEKVKFLQPFVMASGILLLSFIPRLDVMGQAPSTASVSESGIIQLPADQPLTGSYHFDMSQHQFSSDAAMTQFLSNKSGEHYIIRALPHLQKGVIMLSLEKHPSWTVSDWNAHLYETSALNSIAPATSDLNPND